MLDPASVPQPKPASSPAPGGPARQAAKDEAGFHGRLREALDSPQGEERPGRSGMEAHSADRRDDDRPAQQASRAGATAETKTTEAGSSQAGASAARAGAENDADAGAAAPQVESAHIQEVADAAAFDVLLTGSDANEATAGQLAPLASDLSASLVLTQPAAATFAAQAAVGLPDGADGPEASAGVVVAQPGTQVEAEAQAAPGAEQLRSQMMAAQQSAASRGAAVTATDQQQGVANVLAAAPSQAAASQAAPSPQQPTGGASKSTPPASGKEALEAAKPPEPLSLLAKALSNIEAATDMKAVVSGGTKEAVLHLVPVEAPAAAGAKPSGEMRAEGLPMQPPGFMGPDGMPQRADAPVASSPAREFSAPAPARQLSPVVVSLVLGRGDEALTIALDPVELGRVEVSIGQGKEAGQVRIVAERPETLALLQRDQRELDRALSQAGLGDAARSLSFSLASDQGRQQHQQHAAHQGGNRFSNAIGGIEAERPNGAVPPPARAANSLLDIAV
ncbi:MAG: flagellar hook-length control protein FliK [Roseomonas sp.]|nr:flagellar hook-length control protein FliK [Roseomonas sp.]MCA3381756.1 flagellar hook-length control protein FliK [Roseomonas sp.]